MSLKKWILVSAVILITASVTAAIPDGAKAIKVSGGEDHTLVLTENRFVWGCGDNAPYCQLGIGSGTWDRWTLVRVLKGQMDSPSDYLEDINDIDGGWKHSLALDIDGFVWAWGNNEYGQLGDNSETPRSTPIQVHGPNDVGFLEGIISISAGRSGEHSLAVDCNNHVWAWGRNVEGQLGIDANGTGQKELTPVKVDGGEMGTTHLEDIIAVSAGERHSMALDANGFVYTWGSNRWPGAQGGGYEEGWGKLGIANTVDDLKDTPMKVHGVNDVGSLENIVAIAAGWDHCIALERYEVDINNPLDPNNSGRVYTWGNNGEGYGTGYYYSNGGRLGDGTTTDSNVPVIVLSGEQDPCETSPLTGIVAIAAGEAHSLALDVAGFVWAWGDNYHGQLGNGTNDPCTTPVKVVGPDGTGRLGNIVAISAGYWHSIAVDSDGTVYTWGKNISGQLGLGDGGIDKDCNKPCTIAIVRNITQDTAGFRIQAAIDDANNVDVIVADPASYHESINFGDKEITVRSTDPNDFDITAKTIINPGDIYATIVKLYNNPGAALEGFTLTGGDNGVECEVQYSVCEQSSMQIRSCIIEYNSSYGVQCVNNDPIQGDYSADIKNCRISNNDADGIYCEDCDLTVSRCIIEQNGNNGISGINYSSLVLTNSKVIKHDYEIDWSGGQAVIKNSFISDAGRTNSNTGIKLSNPASGSVIRNSTILHDGCGINTNSTPAISHCIVQGPNPFDGSGYDVTYSCVEDGYEGTGNIDVDPCFVETGDPNNYYHLDIDSLCIDAGDTGFEPDPNETDIDGEDRVTYDRVDIGADEYYYSPADYDEDEIVNFLDYALLAGAWQSSNSELSLDDDNDVDIDDLAVFCGDWLWKPAWEQPEELIMGGCGMGGEGMAMIGMIPFGFEPLIYLEPIVDEPPTTEFEPLITEGTIITLAEIWLSDEKLQETLSAEQMEHLIKLLRAMPRQ